MPYNVKLVDEKKGKNKNIKTPFGAISKKAKEKQNHISQDALKCKIRFRKSVLYCAILVVLLN